MLIHPHQMEDALAQINADHLHFHMGSSVNRLLHDLPLPSEDQAADHPINIGQAMLLCNMEPELIRESHEIVGG
jgi:hypothetical protein